MEIADEWSEKCASNHPAKPGKHPSGTLGNPRHDSIIRGQQVILDSDLALLYQVETKRLNERIKRNLSRFPESFCFQLTKEENDELFATYPDNPAIKNPGSGLLLTEELLQ